MSLWGLFVVIQIQVWYYVTQLKCLSTAMATHTLTPTLGRWLLSHLNFSFYNSVLWTWKPIMNWPCQSTQNHWQGNRAVMTGNGTEVFLFFFFLPILHKHSIKNPKQNHKDFFKTLKCLLHDHHLKFTFKILHSRAELVNLWGLWWYSSSKHLMIEN